MATWTLWHAFLFHVYVHTTKGAEGNRESAVVWTVPAIFRVAGPVVLAAI